MNEQEAFDYLVECRRSGKKPSGHLISGFELDYGKAYCIAHDISWPKCNICDTKLKAGKNGFGKYCSRSCAMKAQSKRNSERNSYTNVKRAEENWKKYKADNSKKLDKAVEEYNSSLLTIKEIEENIGVEYLAKYLKENGVFDRSRAARVRSKKLSEPFDVVVEELKNKDWVDEKIKNEGWTSGDFASYFNCSPNFVASTLRQLYFNSPLQHNYGSSLERKVRHFLDTLGVSYRTGVRDIIPPKELDIYIPDYNLAIEINGVYWHSDVNISDKNYHINKTKACNERGVDLIHLFCFDINDKFDKVKSILTSKLGANKRIYGRKCNTREISVKDYKKFCDENHIQGYVAAKVKLGLYRDEELVAVMSFGKSRFDKNIDWELMRYCSKIGINVIGGAGKLFKHFVRRHPDDTIVSYSQNRLYKGETYERLGFKKIGLTDPNYFWCNGEEVLSRYRTQKHKLNTLLTENEEMRNRGYYKVYDCGQTKWVYE